MPAERRGARWRAATDGAGLARPGRTALAVAARPWLWLTAARLAGRTAMPGWSRRWPPVPLPGPDYLAFRRQTMLGSAGPTRMQPAQFIAYLVWCKRMATLGG